MSSLNFLPGNSKMFPELADLWNASEKYDNLNHLDYSPMFLKNYLANTGVNIPDDSVIVRRKNGRLTAFGMLLFRRDISVLKAKAILMVHPFHRGKGIGRRVFQILLDKAKENECVEITCTIPNFRIYAMKFVEQFGFIKYHSRIKMRHNNISTLKYNDKADGLAIRTINTKSELGLWTTIQNEIFCKDPLYTEVTIDTIKRIVKNKAFIPELAIIGELDETPVGYCLGWPFNPTISSSNNILRINGLGVLSKYRRRGYGKTLMYEVLQRGMNRGYRISELLVGDTNLAAFSLYQELGFRKKYLLFDYRLEI